MLTDEQKKKKRRLGGNDYKISPKEIKFVTYYIETGNVTEAVKLAGYHAGNPHGYGMKMLAKGKIQKELKEQLALFKNEHIASASEIMNFLTLAMRGEVKDQFGLDASLSDRMNAAKELAKRQIDMQKLADVAG